MAKKKYTAIHRIMTKTKPPTYIDPETSFMMEEEVGDKLVAMGAASKAAEEKKEAPSKKASTKKAKVEAEAEAGDTGEDDDLV